MTLALSQEQPPFELDENLRNYLIRMFTDIDNTFKKAGKFPERREMPFKPQTGDVHYFGDPGTHNYDAAITMEGFWGLTSTGWTNFDAAGAGSGITIQDEGVPLAGLANTLNFVGAGVTATGAGATKTVTIPGGVTDHGALTGLGDDDHTQYLLDGAGRAPPQSLYGGTVAATDLTLQGNDMGPDFGQINTISGFDIGDISHSGLAYAVQYAPTQNFGVYVGGGFNVSPNIGFTGGTFIWEGMRGAPNITSNVTPGFAAFTLFNALAILEAGTGAGHNPLQSLCLNSGVVIEMPAGTSGSRTTANNTCVSAALQTRARFSTAGNLTVTRQTGLSFSPTFSTSTGNTVNLGTMSAVRCAQPAVALFQTQTGVENMTAYNGIEFPNMTFGGASAAYSVINSALNAGTNKYCINHTGNAQSRLGGQLKFEADLTGITFGLQDDITIGYGAEFLFLNFTGAGAGTAGQLRISSETPGNVSERFLFEGIATDDVEFNFNCQHFSMGAQSGSVGNNVGIFVAGTRTTQIAGDWSDFLLTQAGNLTLDDAMGTVAGWTINAPSLSAGTGSALNATALLVGGNPGQATNDRTGVRIISNPSGGGGVNAALYVTAGRSRFDGIVDINNGVALGGGAAATLGTIGGAGPTAAAQAQWVQIEVNGVNHWIPAWV